MHRDRQTVRQAVRDSGPVTFAYEIQKLSLPHLLRKNILLSPYLFSQKSRSFQKHEIDKKKAYAFDYIFCKNKLKIKLEKINIIKFDQKNVITIVCFQEVGAFSRF